MSRIEAEPARAALAMLAPGGWEEREVGDHLELSVYGEPSIGEALGRLLGPVEVASVQPGWADRWREFHRPVVVGALWIGPPWEQPGGAEHVIVVDPGQAFGTGAHATTRLCLELLQVQPHGSVADLGCGSGVLSIAAAKLGFAPITAVDHDPVAVAVTRENAGANGVRFEVRLLDLRVDGPPPASLALANLERPLVEELAPRIVAERLIASGYLDRDEPDLPGWRRLDRREVDGWAADLFERV